VPRDALRAGLLRALAKGRDRDAVPPLDLHEHRRGARELEGRGRQAAATDRDGERREGVVERERPLRGRRDVAASVAVTPNVQLPSAARVPATMPFHARACNPAATRPLTSATVAPPGPDSVATTFDGRATRYESVSLSPTPSPFGESTDVEGGDA
jgi:hypothetical protein